jgi:hypothetical protein
MTHLRKVAGCGAMSRVTRWAGHRGLSWYALLALGGCAPAYLITPASPTHFAASTAVALLSETERPNRPFITIASFRGHESGACPTEQNYCTLRARARARGADAVWVQRIDVVTYPGEWKMIQGRLTQLHAFGTPIVQGILLRYTP